MLWRHFRQSCLTSRCIQSYLSRRYSSETLARCRTIAQVLETSPTSDSELPSIISVAATVRTVRKQKKISFAAIGDGSTIQPLQMVLEPVQAQGYGTSNFHGLVPLIYGFELLIAHRLCTGTAVEVKGEWRSSPAGKEQSHELKAQSVKIVGSVEAEVGGRTSLKPLRQADKRFCPDISTTEEIPHA